MQFGANVQAFALLLGAIIVFLISTIQLSLVTRAVIWLAGLAMLAASGAVLLKVQGMGVEHVLPAVRTALEGAEDKSWLMQVYSLNRGVIRGYIVPLLDFFLLFGALVALLALLSFTPGEGMEKITRTLCLLVFGGVLGGIATLVAMATGFGGYPERVAYFGRIAPPNVIDGDTFDLGLVRFRPQGIDALEEDQACYAEGASGWIPRMCGKDAVTLLESVTLDEVLLCKRVARPAGGFERDKYGRVIVTCTIQDGAKQGIDPAMEMVRAGYALATDAHYKSAEEEARQQLRGMWATCTLKPELWREDKLARANLGKAPPEWRLEDVVNADACPAASDAAPAQAISPQ